MLQYRQYRPLDRSFRISSGSRVQLLKPRTVRDIYNAFVQTGEIPRVRSGGIDVSLDMPVCAFGDFDDAMAFADSVLATSSRLNSEKEAKEAEAKAARDKEMADAYAKLHNESIPHKESIPLENPPAV